MKLRHTILSLALATCATAAMQATTPVRRTISHQQPNGQVVTINAVGNGRYTLYSLDGTAVLPGTDGHYYYATLNADGQLVIGTTLAGHAARSTAQPRLSTAQAEALLNAALPVAPVVRQGGMSAKSLTTSTPDGLGEYGKSALGAVQSIGSPTLPVVMVDFADRAFQDTITTAKVTRFFNETGYRDEPAARGSVRDYFVAQSDSLFTPTFEVVAHVKLPRGYVYYGKDGSKGVTDPNARQFVIDALAEASKVADFGPYCTPGSTDVPMVVLMFAGPGQQSSFEDGNSNYLWAKFQQSSFSVNDNKYQVRSYFMGNELLQTYGTGPNDVTGAAIDGVGLFAHEFGHALGLPDYYNTADSSAFNTMGYWDIMDYGQYYQNGYRPIGYTAHERSYLGWLHVTELTDSAQACRLLALDGSQGNEGGARAYVVRNPEHANEYYMFENRTTNTWHTKTMGTGMLITHIDYDRSAWNYNRVNTVQNHQRMQFVPADSIKEGNKTSESMNMNALFAGYRADLFPGTKGVTQFPDTHTPAATLYNGSSKLLERPIYNIAVQPDGSITFSYLDASITGIGQTATVVRQPAKAIYDMSGRRIASWETAAPGLYIVNGVKVAKR